MKSTWILAGALGWGAAACSQLTETAEPEQAYVHTEEEFQRDREAILAMVGEYDVSFDFREVVALQEGYELAEPKLSGGWEVVSVIEDRGGFISMQHLLLVGPEDAPFVVKHWRQDWQYQPSRMMSFQGHDNWDMVAISEEDAAGAWAQSVYQVDDSPRYAGIARWEHDEAISTWEPVTSWRPLPRRDDTTRADYHAIEAVNRHVITPWGWVHEQDNTKVIVGEDGSRTPLVREVGINSYVRTDLARDDAAHTYWAATADYWTLVRAYWDNLEATSVNFHVEDDADGTLLYMPLLDASMRIAEGESTTEEAWVEAQGFLATQVTSPIGGEEQSAAAAGQ